ncbi:transposase DDE domain protein [Orientia tsutsugamushi str. Kato PP]|uniref:Transposase n=1 Tax=Orientia tsutsugamushi TaxID=784 RepID=A0A2U3R736_ORITS|nr:transposase DDE domain protein [Orientia tsutsugamushi str. Kato PP]SPR09042.1 transposase [Orientia tsutsugamushi]
MSFKITKGNKSDLSIASVISEGLSGKLFGDKAYISKELFHQLLTNGLRLFTNLHKDMKTYLLDIDDKRLLNKRSLIESVFNVLKKHMLLDHTMYSSLINFFVHIIASLATYSIYNLILILSPILSITILYPKLMFIVIYNDYKGLLRYII